MRYLSPRLQALADWVLPETPIADIGADHAQLTIYLLKQGICPRAVVTDINPSPLQRACRALAAEGLLSLCEFRLGDGLKPIAPGEVGTVCIAGMGGQTIAGILRDAEEKVPSYGRLLLQPMGVFIPLRRYLGKAGYRIRREKAVSEGGNGLFVIMEIDTRGGDAYPLTDLEAEVGPYILSHPEEGENRAYIEFMLEKYLSREVNMSRSRRDEVLSRLKEIRQDIERLKEAIERC